MSPAFTPTVALLLVLLGIAVGTFGTLVGVGGGFLLAPILLLVYPDESPQTITAISLAVVFVNSLAGSIAYGRQRRIDYRSGLVFGAAGVPGSIVGVFLVGLVARRLFDVVFAVLFLAVGLWLLLRPPRAHQPLRRESGRMGRDLTDRFGNRYQYSVRLALGAAFGVAVGVLSSFLGIGGGVFQVPMMIGALGFPAAIATATSQFVLAILSLVGTTTHVLSGGFAEGHGLRRTASLSAGVLVGAHFGARLSLSITPRTAQRLLALAVLVVAIRLAVAGFG
jgi:uncharacterized membrane protein YfcA